MHTPTLSFHTKNQVIALLNEAQLVGKDEKLAMLHQVSEIIIYTNGS